MHFRWSRLAYIIPSLIFLGAVPGIILVAFDGMTPRLLGEWVFQGNIYSFCIGLPCWLIIPEVYARAMARPPGTRILLAAALLAVFGLAGCLAGNVVLLALGRVTVAQFLPIFFWSLRLCLAVTFTFGSLACMLTLMRMRLTSTELELHHRTLETERLGKLAAETRFASLEARVQPHFLFGTLRSAATLLRRDPEAAAQVLERLETVLRYSIGSESTGLVPLWEEIRIVREFLALEQLRLPDALRFSIDLQEGVGDHEVPALSVLTLVENSVRHSSGERNIRILAHQTGGKLRIEVEDDGPGFEPSTSLKPGQGLDLVRRRLESLLGAAASLEFRSTRHPAKHPTKQGACVAILVAGAGLPRS